MTLTAVKSFSMVGGGGGARRESGGRRAGNVNLLIKVSKPEVHFRAHGGNVLFDGRRGGWRGEGVRRDPQGVGAETGERIGHELYDNDMCVSS